MQSTQTVSAVGALIAHLEAEGVEYIFGIPGGPVMPLYEAMHDSGRIRAIITKHEEGASFMADGYARVRGGLGVCCATTGPGATNALTGVACAHVDSVPVMVLTAQVAVAAMGKGAAQESSVQGIDVVDLYKSVTKSSLMLLAPDRMPDAARYLLRKALTGRTGPVHLSMPADMMKRPIQLSPRTMQGYRTEPLSFDRNAVRAACELLVKAKKPGIIAGHGVFLSRAWTELKRLAEKLRIPVATTPKAKGVFPENHVLSLGVCGFAGSPQADAHFLSGDVDVLLVVGSSLGELATHCWSDALRPRDALIQIDIDPTEIGKNYPVNVGIVGGAKTVLNEMLFHIDRELRWTEGVDFTKREADVRRLKKSTPRYVRETGFDDDSSPIKPQRLMRELQENLPAKSIMFVDIGNVMAWAIHFFQANEPGMFQINLGLGSMGHAVSAAIGGKLAAPDRPVIALCGDGAFAMNGMEVHTAVENQVPVVWVVMNNGGHGMVCHGERIMFKGKLNTGKFRVPLNIAQMAEGMGAKAFRVQTPEEFRGAFQQALQAKGPVVIDTLVDPQEMPPLAIRIETLDKFFEGSNVGGPTVPPVAAKSNGQAAKHRVETMATSNHLEH